MSLPSTTGSLTTQLSRSTSGVGSQSIQASMDFSWESATGLELDPGYLKADEADDRSMMYAGAQATSKRLIQYSRRTKPTLILVHQLDPSCGVFQNTYVKILWDPKRSLLGDVTEGVQGDGTREVSVYENAIPTGRTVKSARWRASMSPGACS
ncbi:hypothetical protein C8J57DRAFT_1304575 [Mycena rebaudengoi]|nr:hypothetical protein C8J57DRAFT_1304575 [Mycena rebaudengoi]